MVFISKYLVPKGYSGITLYPFVFLKTKTMKHDTVLLNHEKIHLKQQLELLILPFYLWYVLEFVFVLFNIEIGKRLIKIFPLKKKLI